VAGSEATVRQRWTPANSQKDFFYNPDRRDDPDQLPVRPTLELQPFSQQNGGSGNLSSTHCRAAVLEQYRDIVSSPTIAFQTRSGFCANNSKRGNAGYSLPGGDGELMNRASQSLGTFPGAGPARDGHGHSPHGHDGPGDYAPGTIVTITRNRDGSRRNCHSDFVESPLLDTHPDLTAIAGCQWKHFNNAILSGLADVDITFTLTATGGTSGLQAQTTSLDATSLKTVTVGSQIRVDNFWKRCDLHNHPWLLWERQLHRPHPAIATGIASGVLRHLSVPAASPECQNPPQTSTLTINTPAQLLPVQRLYRAGDGDGRDRQ